jgi:hypothetical protein
MYMRGTIVPLVDCLVIIHPVLLSTLENIRTLSTPNIVCDCQHVKQKHKEDQKKKRQREQKEVKQNRE